MQHIFITILEEESQESGNSQDESESSPTKKSPSKSFGDLSPTKTTDKAFFPDSKEESSNGAEPTEKAVGVRIYIVS
jgi:hypothetical protein